MQPQSTLPPAVAALLPELIAGYHAIISALEAHGLAVPPASPPLPQANERGVAAAIAHPMQGVLKYHGLSDWAKRIAYLPSISVNNGCAHTVTHVAFDPDLPADHAVINGVAASGRELERVSQILDAVRQQGDARSFARVRSANLVPTRTVGKGLGTSASAGAALAAAALGALYGPAAVADTRRLTTTARLLAGSACRSAAGGLALWLSYPGIASEDSLALRLDAGETLSELALVTVPIDSRVGLKTEAAHHDAPQSSFFAAWLQARSHEIIECMAAIRSGDWQRVGQFAELDSMRLHGVTMSGSRENKLIGWEPENIAIFRLCNALRDEGVPTYASTDTGPTVVLLTHRDTAEQVAERVRGLGLGLEAVVGPVGGPARLLDPEAALRSLE